MKASKFVIYGHFLLAIVLSSITLSAESQHISSDGYVIRTDGDTLYGRIRYNGSRSSKTCILTSKGSKQEFSPDQLKGFGIGNNIYFSSQVISSDFVEVIVDGELSLYRSGYIFYIRKYQDELRVLEAGQIKDTAEVKNLGINENVYGYRENNRWKGVLTVLTSDCTDSYQTIQDITYDEKDLIRFVLEYNRCKGAKYINYRSR